LRRADEDEAVIREIKLEDAATSLNRISVGSSMVVANPFGFTEEWI
jgi:hypothetical protein